MDFIDNKAITESKQRFSNPPPPRRMAVMNVMAQSQSLPKRVPFHAGKKPQGVKGKDSGSCRICKGGHGTIQCSKFVKADVRARHALAREFNFCKKCLKSSYPHADCNKTYKVCNGGHHELFHFNTPKPRDNPRQQAGPSSSATTVQPAMMINAMPTTEPGDNAVIREPMFCVTGGAKRAV